MSKKTFFYFKVVNSITHFFFQSVEFLRQSDSEVYVVTGARLATNTVFGWTVGPVYFQTFKTKIANRWMTSLSPSFPAEGEINSEG